MRGVNFRERSRKKPNVVIIEEWSAEDDALPIEPKNLRCFSKKSTNHLQLWVPTTFLTKIRGGN